MTPGYRLTANAPLRDRNTFGVQASAPWLIEVDDASALAEVMALPQVAESESLVIGGGSNLLFAGDAPGAVIAMATHGLRVLSDDGEQARVRADAGVAWHPLVMWTLEQGLCGLGQLPKVGEELKVVHTEQVAIARVQPVQRTLEVVQVVKAVRCGRRAGLRHTKDCAFIQSMIPAQRVRR